MKIFLNTTNINNPTIEITENKTDEQKNKMMVNLLSILDTKGDCTIGRLKNLARKKFNITDTEVDFGVKILLDLEVIKTELKDGGDGWNTRYKFEILKRK